MVKSYKKNRSLAKTIKKKHKKTPKKTPKTKKIYTKKNVRKLVKKVNNTKTKQSRNVVNQPELVPNSNILYSENPLTGEKTVVQTQQIKGDKFQSFMMKSESQIPPTIYKSNNGSTTFSMSKKRQMVVQSYSIGNKY